MTAEMPALAARLSALGMHHTAEHLDDIVARITKRRMSATQLLESLCEAEEQERAQRSLERRHARSKLGRFKPMADFDWAWPKKIDRKTIDQALSLDFLNDNRNIVLVAAQGLGKTMLAKNIAHQAILAGHSVLFVTAADMLLDLTSQESARALERRLKHYVRFGLLCIDEIGYLSYDDRNADLLFRVISMRYEKKPVVLTTNLGFPDWRQIFPNAACTVALIDRIVHYADVITIEGDSYRLKEAKERPARRARRKAHA
jgi:DNA replication protein DnaC